MKILVASSSFKDVYSPLEACEILESSIKTLCKADVQTTPMVDGGEYLLETVSYNLGKKITPVISVTSPYGNTREAHLIELNDRTALISSSEILRLYPNEDSHKNPWELSTKGLGELINSVVSLGYKHIVLGLGGTNTIDGGIGLAAELGMKFFDGNNQAIINPKGKDLERISGIDPTSFISRLDDIKITLACDASAAIEDMDIPNNNKIGDSFDSVRSAQLEFFRTAMPKYFSMVSDLVPEMKFEAEFLGAAGGLAISFLPHKNLNLDYGSEYFAKMFSLDEKISQSDLVLTGEGKIDNTLLGKAPAVVAKLSRSHERPLIYLCGQSHENYSRFFNLDLICSEPPDNIKSAGFSEIAICFSSDNLPKKSTYAQSVEMFRTETAGRLAMRLKNILPKYLL